MGLWGYLLDLELADDVNVEGADLATNEVLHLVEIFIHQFS
jgi:hypothetical protein